jgi:hypothetical protein
VQGLRASGLPVTVLKEGDAVGARDVATMAGPDHAIVAHCKTVTGLERKVVVFVQSDWFSSKEENDGRHFAISRTTSQLIWVKAPPPQEHSVIHTGPGHSQGEPSDCEQCGQDTADILLKQLHVGHTGV